MNADIGIAQRIVDIQKAVKAAEYFFCNGKMCQMSDDEMRVVAQMLRKVDPPTKQEAQKLASWVRRNPQAVKNMLTKLR